MRAVVQRVRDASVRVGGRTVGSIEAGLLVYLGVGRNDSDRDLRVICDKIANLRIFPDDQGKMNLSVQDARGGILVVSQFTLFGDARDGRRPSYIEAAPPDLARGMYEKAIDLLRSTGLRVEAGEFQASMEVSYTNLGPVTILLDSEKKF
ncbi:MAG TPA: D-aminoacyl-tRNA deacylase [Spirochaetia bacterium]|nr:D-aminoacyl-tRNA deacylase [Spirochaetia bacterium]